MSAARRPCFVCHRVSFKWRISTLNQFLLTPDRSLWQTQTSRLSPLKNKYTWVQLYLGRVQRSCSTGGGKRGTKKDAGNCTYISMLPFYENFQRGGSTFSTHTVTLSAEKQRGNNFCDILEAPKLLCWQRKQRNGEWIPLWGLFNKQKDTIWSKRASGVRQNSL